jgi:hypothetical protein
MLMEVYQLPAGAAMNRAASALPALKLRQQRVCSESFRMARSG